MQTVTTLAQAMADAIADAVPDIDAVDLNSYLPAVETRRAALVGVPTGSSTTLTPLTLGGEWEALHRVRLQLWVKVDTGAADDSMERARNIGHLALIALARADGDGYALAPEGTPLLSEVGPDILSVAEVPYVLVTLTVTVWETDVIA